MTEIPTKVALYETEFPDLIFWNVAENMFYLHKAGLHFLSQ
jgi:hypothetical protein